MSEQERGEAARRPRRSRVERIYSAREEGERDAPAFQQPPAPSPDPLNQAPDYSAYRPNDGPREAADDQPAYAPPTRLRYAEDGYAEPVEGLYDNDVSGDEAQPPVNVYRPLEPTWAGTARHSVLADEGARGYQVRYDDLEAADVAPPKRHRLRNALIALAALVLVGGAAYWFRQPLGALVTGLVGAPAATDAPYVAVTTPAPVKGYDAAPRAELGERARDELSAIADGLPLETVAVTATNALARHARADGLYDFYLFSSEGRLLCYFDGLDERGVTPVENGGFYVKQEPYLVKADGAAMVRLAPLRELARGPVRLGQLTNGWAVLEDVEGRSYNYLNADGTLLSALWFSRAYPFTGEYTAAYADTGAEGAEDRYLLYALSSAGEMTKLSEAADMTDVAASACGAVCLRTGELYWLASPDQPLMTTDEVVFYPDCDAMVARDPATGKRGLYVHGEKRYDCAYDEIAPVVCEIVWEDAAYALDAGTATLRAVSGAGYPQPLTHYFALTRDGQTEYVALSATTSCPVLLEGQP